MSLLKMKVSVIVTSYRLGGIDLLFQGIKNQTMSDFELLFVDTLFKNRREQVESFARRLGIDDRLVYLPPPMGVELPQRHFAASLNVGLRKAAGDLLVFINDYSYPLPRCIEEHWDVYKSSGGKTTTIGSFDYVDGPEISRRFKPVLSEKLSMKQYLLLIEESSQTLGVSIFENEFTTERVEDLKERKSLVGQRFARELEYHGLSKGDLAPWFEWCYKNDSVPREMAQRIGGVDEDLGTQDEFAFGYDIVMAGQRLVLNPKNRVLVSRYIDLFPSTVPLHAPLESYEILVRKRNVSSIKLRDRVSPIQLGMWNLRRLLLSPRVAGFLQTVRLEGIGLAVIGAMALGRVDEGHNRIIVGTRGEGMKPGAKSEAAVSEEGER